MDTEDWILKGKILITNTKKQRLKIQSRGYTLKNTILKKLSKITKFIKNIYEIFFKNRVFFATTQQVIKMKTKGVIKNLKIKKTILKIKKMVIVKYIQEFLWSC